MAITIRKRIRFCAGHRLFQHEGKCAFLHGHNYIADVFVTGEEVDSVGRLVDFSILKRTFKTWIDENWDHSFLLNEVDKEGIAAIRMIQPDRCYILPYNPTAENMARHLFEDIAPELLTDFNVEISKVVIWETDDSFAEVTRTNAVVEENLYPLPTELFQN